jgi:hypothetical protein
MSEQRAKYSPRVDEQLEQKNAALTHGAPTENRGEGFRDQAPADGELDVGSVGRPDLGDDVDAELDTRAELAASLRPSAFPATAAELVAVAEEEHLRADLLDWLRTLPEGNTFDTFSAVWAALGGTIESRTT